MSHPTRRHFLKVAAGTGGALAFGGLTRASSALPPPNLSGINHIVVLMMENRSLDHFLRWLPNANGMQAGLAYADSNGTTHPTHALANDNTNGDFQGCGFLDPGHSLEDGPVQYNGGACN